MKSLACRDCGSEPLRSDEVIEGFGHQWVVMTDPEGDAFNIVRRPTSA